MLENPFKPITPAENTDPTANAQLVEAILGSDAAKKYAELDAGREGKKGDTREDLKLSDSEKTVVKEVKEKEVWDRAHYIRWAESLGRSEEWVDRNFTFHPDGSVECGDLILRDVTELHEFPLELKVTGYLDLADLTSAKGLVLPEIGRSLFLNRLVSVEDLRLPEYVGEDLNLDSVENAQGLTLPTSIGKALHFSSLNTLDGLTLPASFVELRVPGSIRAEVQRLKEVGKIGDHVKIKYNHSF